jgi:hypothetical protein
MWVLKIKMDLAAKEEIHEALDAAKAVFARDNVRPVDGMHGYWQLEGWDDRGFPEDDPDYTSDDARNADAWLNASEAALEVLRKDRSWLEVCEHFEMTVVEVKDNTPADIVPVAANTETDLRGRRAA